METSDNELTRVRQALNNFKLDPENLYVRTFQLVNAVEDLLRFIETGQVQWTFTDRTHRFQLDEQHRAIQRLEGYIQSLESQLRAILKGGTHDSQPPYQSPTPDDSGG